MILAAARLRSIAHSLPTIINLARPFSTTAITATMDKKPNGSILDWADKSGEFKRQQSVFRSWIENKPNAEFPPEKGRYHLYVSYACPWAHRTLIVRELKGLNDIISYNSVHWHMGEKGWRFATSDEKVPGNTTPDTIHKDVTYLRDIYFEQNPDYEGRFTVPTLYDKKTNRIVSNESSEIIRMFYTAFDDLIDEEYKKVELFPEKLRKEIEEMNEWVYNDVNNGVYKSGFATYVHPSSNNHNDSWLILIHQTDPKTHTLNP
jgi:putative glutathione S-transferase